MLAKTFSAAVIGIDAYMVEVEVNATGSGEQDSRQHRGETRIKEGHGGTPEGLGSGPMTICIVYFICQDRYRKVFEPYGSRRR